MSFTSPQFLVFFIVVCGLNLLIPNPARKYLLLSASFVFIASFNFLSLLAIIVFSSFTFILARHLPGRKNKALFYFSLFVNGLAIIFFNYILATGESIAFSFTAVDFKVGSFLLIVGLSFYNLQHIAYLIDVQKNRISPEKNYCDFLLISCYFPKFISGPLTLYQELKPQLQNRVPVKSLLWQGFNRILLGFFKKMVLADTLAPGVSSIFDYNDDLPGITILAGAILFTIQLYFDFSGYCDIAIGASKMLGIELPENFDFPLRATSITIFWRKWHRSLIHFFTTYIFYPVSFKYRRLKQHAAAIAIILTFFISAVWHGIGFTFLLWALCHAFYLLFELYFKKNRSNRSGIMNNRKAKLRVILPRISRITLNCVPLCVKYRVRLVKFAKFVAEKISLNSQQCCEEFLRLKKVFSIAFVLFLVSFSNIFFRSTTFTNCKHLLSEFFSFAFFPKDWAVEFVAPLAVGGHQAEHFNFLATLFFALTTLLFERKIFAAFNAARFRPLLTFVLMMIIFLFGVFNSGQRFIYMQF